MVAKLLNYNTNISTFTSVLPIGVQCHVELRLKLNNGIDVNSFTNS
jgi:hypothetical protein